MRPRRNGGEELPRVRDRGGGREEIPHPTKPEARGGRREELPHTPMPEARGGGREDQPHVVAVQAQEGLEELSHLKVRKGGGQEISLVQGKEQWLRFAGAAVNRYPRPR